MNGICIYERKRSPFYYAAYPCPVRLKRVHEATPFRTDDPRGERQAYLFAKDKSAGAEILLSGAKAERFETWVLPWLTLQYRHSPKTLQRYEGAWFQWRTFLRDVAKVSSPRGLNYQHVLDFHTWRTSQVKKSGRKVGTNTALCDIKIMQAVMTEAGRRGFADENPCKKIGIKKDPVRHAHRIFPKELALIAKKLPAFVAEDPAKRAWMPIAYTIARHQGCRLTETRLNMKSQVNLAQGQITFIAKGSDGKPNVFVTAMHKKVRPLLVKLATEKRAYTLDFPVNKSVLWRKFFDRIGLPHVWFHCLRSTVATEMAVGGVPISLAMRFQGHAKEEIHRAYQDVRAGELSVCTDAIG